MNALSVTLKAQNPQGVSQWSKAQEQTGNESRAGQCHSPGLSPGCHPHTSHMPQWQEETWEEQ